MLLANQCCMLLVIFPYTKLEASAMIQMQAV